MNNVSEPIRFGDVVKLQTKSQFVKNATLSSLGFLDVPGKAETQLLVVPPVADEAKDRFVDAEFIIAPIRGVNHQPNGTPLTYFTPFVLRTSDGKDGSAYSLNNKLAGQRDGVTLQLAAAKGEMYIHAMKEGCKKTTGLHYGEDDIYLRVVDSNRVRKTYNNVITHIEKPKSDTPGGIVASGNKGTALTFRFKHVVDAEGQPLIETRKYIKNPQARRSSMDASSPGKMDQLGRADRVDSSEFSDVDALSRSSSIAGLSSNPASPRGAPSANALTTPVDAAAVAARLPAYIEEVPETDDTVSSSSGSATASGESALRMPANSSAETQRKTSAATPVTPPKNAVVGSKTSAPVSPPSPVKTTSAKAEAAKAEPAKVEKAGSVKGNTPVKDAAAKAEPVKVEAGVVKNGTAETDAAKAADFKAEAPKSDSVKAGISFWSRRESSKSLTAKADPVKETTPVKDESSKVEPAKPEAANAETTRAEAVKTVTAPVKVQTATTEPLKAETAPAKSAKADTAKAQAGKAEPVKKEASGSTSFWSRRESSKSVTAKADPVKGEASKAGKPDSVKADTAKAEPVKAEAAKSEPVKAETVTTQSVKAEAAKAESVKAADASVELAKAKTSKTGSVKAEQLKVETAATQPVKADAAKPGTAKSDPLKTTQDQHATKNAAAPPAAATAVAKSAPGEPKTVLADASTFPPTPAINGPAPAPVVMSPKASASPKTTPKAGATPTSTPASPKMMKEEEVAKLKAEAEVENLEPACGAKCSVM